MEICTLPLKRWDAQTGESADWNDLHMDPELWCENGDCFVFLYQSGTSMRGPSFRIPLALLDMARCRRLLDMALISPRELSPFSETTVPTGNSFLYLHAPENVSREQTYHYHITTRNFFAWVMNIPLVGADPVSAVWDLKKRMDEWRDPPADNTMAIYEYLWSQGYYKDTGNDDTIQDKSLSGSQCVSSTFVAQHDGGYGHLPPMVPLRTSSKRASSKSKGAKSKERSRLGTTPRHSTSFRSQRSAENSVSSSLNSPESPSASRRSLLEKSPIPLYNNITNSEMQSSPNHSDSDSMLSLSPSTVSSAASSTGYSVVSSIRNVSSSETDPSTYWSSPDRDDYDLMKKIDCRGKYSDPKRDTNDGNKTEAVIDRLLNYLHTAPEDGRPEVWV